MLQTPENWLIADTTPLIALLDGRYPERRLFPDGLLGLLTQLVEDFFDDLCMHLVREVYGRDFELFGYDIDDPSRRDPVREIDLDAVHARLAA